MTFNEDVVKFIKDEKKYFIDFLSNFEVIGLTIASILGLSITTFSKTFIDQIVMPLIEPMLEVHNWKNYKITIGSSTLGIGLLFSEFVYLLFIALIMFTAYSIFKIYLEDIIDKKHQQSDTLLYLKKKNSEQQQVMINELKSIKNELINSNKL